jgi:hypothetical protein
MVCVLNWFPESSLFVDLILWNYDIGHKMGQYNCPGRYFWPHNCCAQTHARNTFFLPWDILLSFWPRTCVMFCLAYYDLNFLKEIGKLWIEFICWLNFMNVLSLILILATKWVNIFARTDVSDRTIVVLPKHMPEHTFSLPWDILLSFWLRIYVVFCLPYLWFLIFFKRIWEVWINQGTLVNQTKRWWQ